jgi:hypothetical protein
MKPEQFLPDLATTLKEATEAARNKPNRDAWQKAVAYVTNQASKGFDSCTLPSYSNKQVVDYICKRFTEEGLTVGCTKDGQSYLLYVAW